MTVKKQVELDQDEYQIVARALDNFITFNYASLNESGYKSQKQQYLDYIEKIEKLKTKLSNIEAK